MSDSKDTNSEWQVYLSGTKEYDLSVIPKVLW